MRKGEREEGGREGVRKVGEPKSISIEQVSQCCNRYST